MEGLRRIKLDDGAWGEIRICYSIPRPGNLWGVLKPLQETSWGKLIPEISGDSLSEALHGNATPFMREAGRAPKDIGRRLTASDATCRLRQDRSCHLAKDECTVSPLRELPFCYEAPNLEPPHFEIANFVAQMWNEGHYVVVLKTEGFVL